MLIRTLLLAAIGLLAATTLEAKSPIENMKEEVTFLRDNKDKEGVKVTDSGLQYEIIKQGDGPKPGLTSRVKVHYRGTLLDGEVFDSSYTNGQPAVFGVNQVIAGWTEALQMMPVGSKWKLFIPSKLAYGARGAGRVIGPNACLIFQVELIEIVE
ncbi:MAG: FKBP-type peptidyl-prolyl cis-trans isomerase [Verrucomicrobiota bacterium]